MKTKTNKLTQIFTSIIAISIVPLLSFADGGNRFDGTYNLVRQEVGIKNFNPSDYPTVKKENEPWICKESLVVNSTEFQDGPNQIRINGFRIEDRTGCYSTYEEAPKKTSFWDQPYARTYRTKLSQDESVCASSESNTITSENKIVSISTNRNDPNEIKYVLTLEKIGDVIMLSESATKIKENYFKLPQDPQRTVTLKNERVCVYEKSK